MKEEAMMGATRWWSKDTVAVVTGANKGIGYEIARQLAKNGLMTVLTARDEGRGQKAVQSLKKELGVDHITFHGLDVSSEDSAGALAHWLQQTYGGADILINNAAVLLRKETVEDANLTLRTNYYGVKWVTKAILPILRHSPTGARVIVVSSNLGKLNGLRNNFRAELTNRNSITEDQADHFVSTYLQEVKNGTWKQGGWPGSSGSGSDSPTSYCVSKIAVNAYVSVLARELSNRPEGQRVYVNTFTPGYTQTDMTSQRGFNTVEEAAITGLWLALHPPGGPSGKFWSDKDHRQIEF